jgi:aspartyl-tRNA synthetase
VAAVVKHLEFQVFAGPANDPAGRVAALCVPGGAALSRKDIDGLTEYAARYGARGLAWLKVEDLSKGREGIKSPVAKFLDDAALEGVLEAVAAQTGDIVFFGAGAWKAVSDFMGALRLKIGKDRGLVEAGWKPLWVTDFPMFEYDADAQRYVALHHPFTAPKIDDIADLRAHAATAVSRGYDMVLNGNEIGGGSIRIHRPDMQSAVFELLGIGAAEAEAKFGFLLKALKFGAPPHGGVAFGIDRIAALMAGTESIRDVIAFPKTTSAQDLMTDAPSTVAAAQLKELHVRVASGERGTGNGE